MNIPAINNSALSKGKPMLDCWVGSEPVIGILAQEIRSTSGRDGQGFARTNGVCKKIITYPKVNLLIACSHRYVIGMTVGIGGSIWKEPH